VVDNGVELVDEADDVVVWVAAVAVLSEWVLALALAVADEDCLERVVAWVEVDAVLLADEEVDPEAVEILGREAVDAVPVAVTVPVEPEAEAEAEAEPETETVAEPPPRTNCGL